MELVFSQNVSLLFFAILFLGLVLLGIDFFKEDVIDNLFLKLGSQFGKPFVGITVAIANEIVL